MNVCCWDRIVGSWAAGDCQGLDDAWTTDLFPDLGSWWGRYEYVTGIGFAAQKACRFSHSVSLSRVRCQADAMF